MTDRTISNRSTVERYFATLQALDEEAWIALHAPEAVTVDSSGARPIRGRSAHRDLLAGLRGGIECLSVEERRIWTAPDGAAARWTIRIIGQDGRDDVLEGVDVFELDEESRILAVRRFWERVDPPDVAR